MLEREGRNLEVLEVREWVDWFQIIAAKTAAPLYPGISQGIQALETPPFPLPLSGWRSLAAGETFPARLTASNNNNVGLEC